MLCRNSGMMAGKAVSCWKMVLTAAAALGTLAEAGLSPCAEGQYFNADARSCLACAMCPKNQIIRVPCTQHADTVCGPFFEFYEFHQAPRPTLKVDDLDLVEDEGEGAEWNSDSDPGHHGPAGFPDSARAGQTKKEHPSRGKTAQESRFHGGGDSDVNDPEDLESWQVGEFPSHRTQGTSGSVEAGRGRQSQEMHSLQRPGEEESQWKVLALALIIVLCVVCLVLIVFIFVLCYLRASRSSAKKALFGTANGTCPGRGRHYLPPLPHYYLPVPVRSQAQTTTSGPGETNDGVSASSGQTQAASGDSEREGARLHPTPSSEYVYFKSPQNGNEAAADV